MKKRISLVLGSGGARGLAHIGVIHWLQEHDFEISTITGSSMGALVGGIEAVGKLDEYERWVRAVRKIDILSLMDISLKRGGLVKGDKIIQTLVQLVGDEDIEKLAIPYTAVAVDINAKKEVWIREGSVFDAIRASISIPLLFRPFQYRGLTLVDGGVLNPVPIAPTFADRTDLTVAVNLCASPSQAYEHPKDTTRETTESEEGVSPLSQRIGEFIEWFRSSDGDDAGAGVEQEVDMQSVAIQSFEAMQGTIARQKLAAYPPDVVINIPSNACGSLEFYRASELIELGYAKAEESMAVHATVSGKQVTAS